MQKVCSTTATKLTLSTSTWNMFNFNSNIGIEWKLILVQLFHFNKGYFHDDTGHSQSQIRIANHPMRSWAQRNQLFELVLSAISWFDYQIALTIHWTKIFVRNDEYYPLFLLFCSFISIWRSIGVYNICIVFFNILTKI